MEQEPWTLGVDEQPTDVRTRRAAVLAGIGLVWAALMASLGFFLVALAVLVAATAGAAWILGVRAPRYDVRGLAARVRASAAQGAALAGRAGVRSVAQARSGGAVAARVTGIGARRALAGSRVLGAAASRELRAAGRATADRLSATPELAGRAMQRGSEALRGSRPKLSRRRDPRIDEALASNSQGIALAKAGKPAEAIDAFDTALALLAETGDRHREGQVLANLGVVHRSVGGTEAARFCWTRALERLEPGTRESERTAELLGPR
jgi:tetratricopeptide (TPR) repeat protein